MANRIKLAIQFQTAKEERNYLSLFPLIKRRYILQYSRSKVELILNFKVIGVQLFRNKIVRQIGNEEIIMARQDL